MRCLISPKTTRWACVALAPMFRKGDRAPRGQAVVLCGLRRHRVRLDQVLIAKLLRKLLPGADAPAQGGFLKAAADHLLQGALHHGVDAVAEVEVEGLRRNSATGAGGCS